MNATSKKGVTDRASIGVYVPADHPYAPAARRYSHHPKGPTDGTR